MPSHKLPDIIGDLALVGYRLHFKNLRSLSPKHIRQLSFVNRNTLSHKIPQVLKYIISPMISIENIINQEIESINKAIDNAKKQRDEAATPMESQHDQTRQHADQLVQALQKNKAELLAIKINVNHQTKSVDYATIGSFVETENVDSKQRNNFLIVPEGLGGKKIDDIILLGEHAPLAKIISGQKTGYLYAINDTKYVIKKINHPLTPFACKNTSKRHKFPKQR
ncbi:MAG: hypothetical protein UV28_C0003G0019 [Candidatus Collierbacteria bacterium GW2011_GWE2_42_48]|nr:MAG: hypothetical protein UV30_C0016G0008 [Candidatus Collierbacteria bacterium GW2011_GWF1_42_50]KKS62921.1 MAG: hypothetical protein UV28_C0003G0019 [Candidatus Collierbacteria bacterium GW2011_GWE2_42_48]KKS63468.1 MAG: hypothetical protein UV29_C0001G0025 [Candidatus Collierbacteria bacterium GW2011_GWD2_42_50]KKS64544.1 MAG: hypothetical protein UV32_C0012G0028 [Candidatus Collierbacteria bacterium GW2011_GWF2_42_51]